MKVEPTSEDFARLVDNCRTIRRRVRHLADPETGQDSGSTGGALPPTGARIGLATGSIPRPGGWRLLEPGEPSEVGGAYSPRSRTKTSDTPFVSPLTRFVACETNAT